MSEILTQSELAQRLIQKTDVNPEVAKNFANVFFSIVKKQLKKSDSFSVYNFGTFKKTWIEESWGFNPSNGEKIKIPSHYRIKFIPCAAVARRINKKYALLKPKVIEEKVDENESLLYKAEKENEKKKSLLYKASRVQEELEQNQVAEESEEDFYNPPESLTAQDVQDETLTKIEELEEDEKELNKKPKKLFVILSCAFVLLLILISVLIKCCSKKEKQPEKEVENEILVEEEPKSEEKEEIQEEIELSFEEMVIKYGSSYHKIAKEKYQNPHLWPYIFSANKAECPDPDLIISGKNLIIPEQPDLQKNKTEVCMSVLDAYNAYLLMCEKQPENPKNQKRKNLAVRVIVSGEILYPGFIDEYSERILPDYAQKAKNIAKNQFK